MDSVREACGPDRAYCLLCNAEVHVSESWCYGCRHYICQRCNEAGTGEGLTGPHTSADHVARYGREQRAAALEDVEATFDSCGMTEAREVVERARAEEERREG